MVTRDDWQALAARYEKASAALDEGLGDAETTALVDAYLEASEAAFAPIGFGIDAADTGTKPTAARAALAAADIDIAVRLLERVDTAPAAGIDAPATRSHLDLASVDVEGDAPMVALADASGGKKELNAAVDACYDGVLDASAAVFGDLEKLVGKIGMTAIVGAAGSVATAALGQAPIAIRWAVDKAIRAIQAAADKLRSWITAHLPDDIEKRIAKWWDDTVGADGFKQQVLAAAGNVAAEKAARHAAIDSLSADGPDFAGAASALGALKTDFDNGDAWVSTAASLTSTAWPLLSAIGGQNAALVGGVIVAAVLAFELLRTADYLDWKGIGPLPVPDSVHGPRHILDAL